MLALAVEGAALAVPGVSKSGGRECIRFAAQSCACDECRVRSGPISAPSHRSACPPLPAKARAWSATMTIPPLPFHGFEDAETIGHRRAAGSPASQCPEDHFAVGHRHLRSAGCGKPCLGHLASASMVASIARGTSFLKSKLGQQIFAKGISVIDDPLRHADLLRGRSMGRAFVQRARAASSMAFSQAGYSIFTRHGSSDFRRPAMLRAASGPPGPSPSNLHLDAGQLSPEQMIGSLKSGLYITELIGNSVNIVTGDYGRGASGFWIENGELALSGQRDHHRWRFGDDLHDDLSQPMISSSNRRQMRRPAGWKD